MAQGDGGRRGELEMLELIEGEGELNRALVALALPLKTWKGFEQSGVI